MIRFYKVWDLIEEIGSTVVTSNFMQGIDGEIEITEITKREYADASNVEYSVISHLDTIAEINSAIDETIRVEVS